MSTSTTTYHYSRKDERKDSHVDGRVAVFTGLRVATHQDVSLAVSTYANQDSQTDVRTDAEIDGRKDGCKDVRAYSRKDERKDVGKDDRTAFVIVLANHKGGVTKTTSTANLGALFAEAGLNVLLVDCDPQANLSEMFGWSDDRPGERLQDLLENPQAAERFAPPAALSESVAGGLKSR